MALHNGTEKVSSQIGIAQYADVTDLMKYMTAEVGDVGQVMLPLNENEGKRRYLNGQIILQEQFKLFTKKLREAATKFPHIICTEEEWQETRRKDPDDQCGKFVIDDVNGVIRLPRIKFLVGSLNIYKMGDGIPNRRLVKQQKPTTNSNYRHTWYNLYSDGWIETGGYYYGVSTTNANITITFPYAFKDTNYHCVMHEVHNSNGNGNTGSESWDSRTKNSVIYRCSSSGFLGFTWRACGYTEVPATLTQYSQNIQGEFESPYYIQVATGVEVDLEEDIVKRRLKINTPYSFGMFQRSVGKLNNGSWLKSDGTYYSGTAYSDYYEWLLKNYSVAENDNIEVALKDTAYSWISATDSNFRVWTTHKPVKVGDIVFGYLPQHPAGYVTAVTDENNFTFFNARTQSNVNVVYDKIESSTLMHLSDYAFILDTTNQTFRLPLLVGDEMVPNYGKGVSMGFPQYIRGDNHAYYIAPYNGFAFLQIDRDGGSGNTPHYSVNGVTLGYEPYWVANTTCWTVPLRRGDVLRIWSDINGNNFNYGVQQFMKCDNYAPLYFYVGETVQDAHLINAGRLAELTGNVNTLMGGVKIKVMEGTHQAGYIVYDNGFSEQWGEFTWSDNGQKGPINLYKPMRDTNYQVYTQTIGTIADQSEDVNIHSKNVSQFWISAYAGNRRIYWKASGYLAHGQY